MIKPPVSNFPVAAKIVSNFPVAHPGGKGGAKGGKGVAVTATPAPVGKSVGKNSNDRSRTPAPRWGKPAQPQKPPPVAANKLPHPWQKHFSEEFQIPYFWNSETLESSWEMP